MSPCVRPHVLVTGASSGIRHAIALYLGTAGHRVSAGVREPDDGAALQRAARGEITPFDTAERLERLVAELGTARIIAPTEVEG